MDQKYTFHVGDEVITDDGRVGKITSICTCDRCKTRGFYEPTVDFHDGYHNYITHWDYENDCINYRHSPMSYSINVTKPEFTESGLIVVAVRRGVLKRLV